MRKERWRDRWRPFLFVSLFSILIGGLTMAAEFEALTRSTRKLDLYHLTPTFVGLTFVLFGLGILAYVLRRDSRQH